MAPSDSPASSAGGSHQRDEEAGENAVDSPGIKAPPRKRRRPPGMEEKTHLCPWPGCLKAFSRVDHLTRHQLNHNPKEIYKCERCPKIFVRNDLLVRHVERHEKREQAAAGGKPSASQARLPSDASTSPADLPFPPPTPAPAPVYPPGNMSWHDQQALQQAHFSFDTQRFAFDASGKTLSPTSPNLYPSPLAIPSFHPEPSPFDQPLDPSLGPSFFNPLPAASSTSSLPSFDDPLNFIQASYGAPFVSASEYGWLFDPSSSFDVTLGSSRPASPGFENFSGLDFGMGLSRSLGGNGVAPFDFAAGNAMEGLRFEAPPEQKWTEAGEFQGDEKSAEKEKENLAAGGLSENPDSSRRPTETDKTADVVGPEEPPYTRREEEPEPRDPSVFVDASTRLRIIDYLGPEWTGLHGDARMTVGALANYVHLFWTCVHETQAPAFHRASFRTDTCPTPLLLSIMLLGAYFAEDKEAHALAMKIHPMFRGKVLCSSDFRPKAEIWLHQTALLVVVFGKLCSTRQAHEMAHVFWSSIVTLARRSGLFSQRLVAVEESHKNDVEVLWAAWIEEETSKRVAHVVFATDVEHAALFRHSPSLSAFQIQLTLPCDEEEWDAPNAIEWARIHNQSAPAIPFISALKASLTTGATPPVLNPFARITILHGLLSVAQDLQWRDHVIGLSQPEGRAMNWRDLCSSAYNSWKARLDTTLATASFPTNQLLRASISLYAVAHITLSIDIHELQIFAGAENALGLVVSPAVFEATSHRIKIWAVSKDGRAATWHAAFFLRSSLQHWYEGTGDLSGCLHHRWAVFIACLTLYCFGRTTSGPPGPREGPHREATMRYLDSMCTDSPDGLIAVPHKNNTLPLLETISEYIQGSRWEIAQEGAKILERLLPAER